MRDDREINVLSVCTNENTGGAPIAAYRIHVAVNAAHNGVVSTMFVKNRQTNDPTVRSVDEFVPHHALYRLCQWVKEKCVNKYWHALWRPYKKTNDKNFKSDLRGMGIGDAFHKMDYDVLHMHWINNRFLRLSDIPSDKPIIWTLHDSWQFCGECHYFLDCENYKQECGCCPQLGSNNPSDLSHLIWKAKQKYYADKNITIVCPTQWLADCAAASGLFRGRDIRVIPNCLDTNVFRPLLKAEIVAFAERQQNAVVSRVLMEKYCANRTQNNLDCSAEVQPILPARVSREEKGLAKPLILYGAANAASDRRKGFVSLLSALQILDKQGSEASLVVFGASETDLPLRFEHISVTFLGYVRDVNVLVNLYNVADVMVVPSYTEVFGQTASEAMACGTPVVAFRCTGIQDVVGADGGYLAEPYSEKDLAYGIEWVLEHNRHGEMRDQVRKSAVERFNIPVVAEQYVDLYKEVAGKNK